LAHTDPRQLLRLCHALGVRDKILVHIDLKTSSTEFEGLSWPGNVEFIPDRWPVSWGDFSMVEATLALMERALALPIVPLRLVLLSGACYPIKPIEALRLHFRARGGRSDICYVNMFHSPEHLMGHISRVHFKRPFFQASRGSATDLIDRAIRKIGLLLLRFWDRDYSRRFPELTPYFGSQWWAITPKCARMIQEFVAARPDVTSFYRNTFAPDEHFFHTIIGNSSLRDFTEGVRPYTGRGTYKLSNLHLIDKSLKKVYTLEDLESILSSTKFFVRKVTSGASAGLLDYLDNDVHQGRCMFN